MVFEFSSSSPWSHDALVSVRKRNNFLLFFCVHCGRVLLLPKIVALRPLGEAVVALDSVQPTAALRKIHYAKSHPAVGEPEPGRRKESQQTCEQAAVTVFWEVSRGAAAFCARALHGQSWSVGQPGSCSGINQSRSSSPLT